MKDVLNRIRAVLRAVELPAEAGPLPLAAGAMLGSEWLAPHLVRLPVRVRRASPSRVQGRALVGEAIHGAPPQTPPKG